MDITYNNHKTKHSIIIYSMIKRAVDIVGGLMLCFIAFPFFLVVPVLIRLDSKGPVFFRQMRNGLGGAPFEMYKFRTMLVNADSLKHKLNNDVDGPMFKVKGDPRVTGFGKILRKWSIDELPQVLNVLRGEMSLVGPRPLAMEEMKGHEEWKEKRLSVKPGLTGLWQVSGRSSHMFSDWVEYDIRYVQNKSLLLDMKILLLTLGAIIRRRSED
jgi:lipopolysaccharide/colanic/teichoic acid biosynthesis glycosyltransferase